MKSKIILIATIFFFLIGSCKLPSYVPKYEKIDVSVKGAYIELDFLGSGYESGELIAANSTELIILTDKKVVMDYEFIMIKKFKVLYAQPKKLAWLVPILTLACIGHGYYGVFTGPINLILGSIIAGNKSVYRYKKADIQISDLPLYARFPQGIPPGLKHSDIK